MIKGQDVIILITLLFQEKTWTIAKIGSLLGLSDSQVHSALQRISLAGLYNQRKKRPMIAPLEEFLIHSIKFLFPGKLGSPQRGYPTARSAPPLNQFFDSDETIVWPDGSSNQKGVTLTPIHKSAIPAAKQDSNIYALLALIDTIRIGRARERALAIEHIKNIFKKLK